MDNVASFWNKVDRSALKWGTKGLIAGTAAGCFCALFLPHTIPVIMMAGATSAGAVLLGTIAGGIVFGALAGVILGAGISTLWNMFHGAPGQIPDPVRKVIQEHKRAPAPCMEPDLSSTKYQDAEYARRQQAQMRQNAMGS